MRAENQHRLLFPYLFAALLMIGCTSLPGPFKMNKFTETSKSYAKALLWSHYEAANLYRKPEFAKKEKPDFEKLKNIKVAQYDIKELHVAENGLRVDQEAEITYFHLDKMILKTLRDQQVWEFDGKERRWYLTSGLPEFQ